MILTSRLGRFEFDDKTLLVHAKMVRDAVVGQWFNPKPGQPKLKTFQEIEAFMRSHSTQIIAGITFALSFHDDKPKAVKEAILEELPQPPLIPVPPIWVRQALVGEQRPDWLET